MIERRNEEIRVNEWKNEAITDVGLGKTRSAIIEL